MGVVTHPTSTYSTFQIKQFCEQRSSLTKSYSTRIKLKVLSENSHGESEVSLLGILLSSLYISMLSVRWQKYLGAQKQLSIRQLASYTKAFFRPFFRLLNPATRRIEKIKSLRILNITSSHLKLLREAIESDYDGILILEDDAYFQSPDLLGSFLEKIIEFSAALPIRKHYIDLSESFSLIELGAAHLVITAESQKLVIEESIFNIQKMSVPITNTVCAVFYSPEFVHVLEKEISKKLTKRFDKYIPIDWLINKILIELYNDNHRVTCYTTNPGIFRQQSLVRSATHE